MSEERSMARQRVVAARNERTAAAARGGHQSIDRRGSIVSNIYIAGQPAAAG
jgi:hypothetical protein